MSIFNILPPVNGRQKKRPSTPDTVPVCAPGPVPLSADEYSVPEISVESIETIFSSFDARRLSRVWLFYMGSVISAVVTFFLFQSDVDYRIALTVLVGGVSLSYTPLGMLLNEFKDRLIPQILIQYGFNYDREASRIYLEDYTDVLPNYSSCKLADHFWGIRNGIKMSVCELTLLLKTGKNLTIVFNGLLCRFDYPKTVREAVAVKSSASTIGRLFQGTFSSADRVKLEDPAFQARFDVYSRDQVTARYILTPTVMQRLSVLEGYNPGLRAIFVGNEVLLAIPNGEDLFHPGSFFSKLDRRVVKQFHNDITRFFAFIDALKLEAQSKI